MLSRLGNEDIADLISRATIAFNALPRSEQDAIMQEQRNSWVRGERALDRVERLQRMTDAQESKLATDLANRRDHGQDVEYNLARVEGQLARLEALLNGDLGDGDFSEEDARAILTNAKGFLTALRNALDTRRIDVA